MNIRVLQDTMVITSSAKLEDLHLLETFDPEALLLMDNEDVLFRVKPSEYPSISKHGICFNSKNTNGYATVTVALVEGLTAEEKIAYIAEKYGTALILLETIESRISTAVVNVGERLEDLKKNIEILG